MKCLFFITGPPGVGKTTILLKAIEDLEKIGVKIGGMLSREVREKGTRIGFEIVDYKTQRQGWLAHVRQRNGPQVGKYRVNLEDLDAVGTEAIRNAVATEQIVAIDEVGPMELHSTAFKRAVVQALDSGKPVIGVIHQRARDSLVDSIRKRDDAQIIQVTYANRDQIHSFLVEKVKQLIREKSQSNS